MKIFTKLTIVMLALGAPVAARAGLPPIPTYAFNFEQTGFTGFETGGVFSGMISAQDLDFNNEIDLSEVTSFMATFVFPADTIFNFSLGLNDLDTFDFALNTLQPNAFSASGFDGKDNEYAFGSPSRVFSGVEAFVSTEDLVFTPKHQAVPDAGGSIALLSIGLLSLARFGRNRR